MVLCLMYTTRIVRSNCKVQLLMDIQLIMKWTFMLDLNLSCTTTSLLNLLAISVSSSSMKVRVVPDHNTMTDVSNTFVRNSSIDGSLPNPISSSDRKARVPRYREKRKNRKFEKTIRYASRKAYAETPPKIKGRFAKRTENDVVDSLVASSDAAYGVVPSF